MIKAYIRSYYDGDREKFHRRFEKGKTFLKFFHDYQIPATIVAQCWPDDLVECVKKEFPSISFDRQEKLGAAGAVNYILKNYLYDTGEDYLFLTDDDILLRATLGTGYLFNIWKTIETSGINGHINFSNTFFEPYHLEYLVREDILKDNKMIAFPIYKIKKAFLFTSFFFNTKKHFNKEIFTTDRDGEKVIYDDYLFGLLCLLNSVQYYFCPFLHAMNAFGMDSVYGRKKENEKTKKTKKELFIEFCEQNTKISENTEAYFEREFGFSVEYLKKNQQKNLEKIIFPLCEPCRADLSTLNPQIRPQVKVDYLKSLENYRYALPYSDDREAKIKEVCGKTQLKDVRKEELLWLRTYRKKISAFTSTLPEEYAKAGKLLNITTGDFHVKNIAEDELKKMNENTMKWYIATGKGFSEIANFEKLREIVLIAQGKLNG